MAGKRCAWPAEGAATRRSLLGLAVVCADVQVLLGGCGGGGVDEQQVTAAARSPKTRRTPPTSPARRQSENFENVMTLSHANV